MHPECDLLILGVCTSPSTGSFPFWVQMKRFRCKEECKRKVNDPGVVKTPFHSILELVDGIYFLGIGNVTLRIFESMQ